MEPLEWLKVNNPRFKAILEGTELPKQKSIQSSPSKDKSSSETEEEKTQMPEFCREFYLDEEMRGVIEEIIGKVIKILKKHWNNDFVIYPITDIDLWSTISFRHTFIINDIDAPLVTRYERFKQKYDENMELLEFCTI